MKKKRLIIIVACILSLSICLKGLDIRAYDFSDEGYWIKVCSGYITDQSTYNACLAFKKYASDRAKEYGNSANSLQASIDEAQGNIDKLLDVIKNYDAEIAVKENEIKTIQVSISAAEKSVLQAQIDIEEKQKNIKKRKKIIAAQMVDMQSGINTNQFIDFIMGAVDLIDLVQRSSGIQTITKNQKEQIETLNKEIKKLNLAKKEQVRIKETLKEQENSLEAAKVATQQLKNDSDALKSSMEIKLNKMLAQRNAANSVAQTLASMPTPSFNISGGSADVGDINSNGLIAPIQGCSISRGIDTWANGHRGVDWAANKGTPIVAPADCYVVFASNSYGDGYFGNLGPGSGIPSGGGNSVRIIFSLNGQTFAMNFHHMTRDVPAINYNGTGKVVPQGTVIGHVGESGNSLGVHAHVEMFKLNGSVQQEIARWYSTSDWQSSAGWETPTPNCGSYGCRIDPLIFF